MRAIVTSGPSYEPVDRVRRLTNFSTGALGTQLSEALAAAGFEVICLRGSMATHRPASPPVRVIPFGTNDDLLARLEELANAGGAAAIFHLAALCDYKVGAVRDAEGAAVSASKLSSRAGGIRIELEPAVKVISQLRGFFPSSIIVGWKYELDGTREEAIEKGRRQLAENGSDACVVNGHAYGGGFGFLQAAGGIAHLPAKAGLCEYLVSWLSRQISPAPSQEPPQ
jgi:phosphopantothenoylcysteine synthetase/decarboxylase